MQGIILNWFLHGTTINNENIIQVENTLIEQLEKLNIDYYIIVFKNIKFTVHDNIIAISNSAIIIKYMS